MSAREPRKRYSRKRYSRKRRIAMVADIRHAQQRARMEQKRACEERRLARAAPHPAWEWRRTRHLRDALALAYYLDGTRTVSEAAELVDISRRTAMRILSALRAIEEEHDLATAPTGTRPRVELWPDGR